MTSAHKLTLVESYHEELRNTEDSDKLASYFYKILNHEELFKIGKGFSSDVKRGVKNFAITSTGYKNSQQKSIIGLCCYFEHNSNYKIAIISDVLKDGFFSELVEASIDSSFEVDGGADQIHYKSFHQNVDFINYADLMNYYGRHLYTKKFEIEIKKILDKYDLIFWDIPEMEKLKQHSDFHQRISKYYESMTVIVGQSVNPEKQIESIKRFFVNYNINLNGILFDSTSGNNQKKQKRKKFLGLF